MLIMNGYIIALDQGTTSSRSIIFDSKGNIVSLAQYPFTQIYPKPGWVEHDPMVILESQLLAMSEAFEKSGLSPTDIAGIGITNQRETTIVWDKNTGKPVYNAIVGQCRRPAPICDQLTADGLGPYVKEKTGLLIDAYFSGTKIKWILDNVPGARERAERGELLFGNVDSWLIWNLTGGRAHVSDYSNCSRTMLFDIDNLCWDEELCARLGWEYEAVAIDWNSKDAELSSGTINCIWNGFTYTGRENDYTFSDPYVDNSIVMVVKADSGITSLADLAGKSVMAQAASSAVDAINENEDFKASLKEVVELGDYNMGFMDLAQGTVDAVAADLGVAQYQIANNDGDYVILDEPLSTEQYAIGFLKGNTELRDAVNAELLKMAEDGTMLEIAQKYVDQGLVLDSLCLINK